MFLLNVSAAQISGYAPEIVWGCIALVLALALAGNAYEKLKSLNSRHHYISLDKDEISVTSWHDGAEGLSSDGVPFYNAVKNQVRDLDNDRAA